jgi:subtilisin-like proprotein convertase family protein
MRHEFANQTPAQILAGPPNMIRSTIEVTDLANARVEDVEVTVDVTHTWTGDLAMFIVSPDGTEVLLVEREGGRRNDFKDTIFRNDAPNPIEGARAPFRGTFRPEGDLTALRNKEAQGTWILRIEDRARQDGGALNRWALGLTTDAVPPSAFHVDVRFLGGLSPAQQAAFADAAVRWSEIITGDVPPVNIDGEIIDDVLIEAQGIAIDGPGGVLGQAGPRFIRPSSNLPIKGIMSFDTADLDRMEADGSLKDVILHEMGHVLGIGTIWDLLGLLEGGGSVDPTFVGASAMREYGTLRKKADPTASDDPTPVPVANTGGAGTRDGHWREVVFGDELLTGFLSGAVRPISRMSVGCFEDMGYQVDYSKADAYTLPSMLRIAELGLFGTRHAVDTCAIDRIQPVYVPAAAMINAP